MPKQRRQVREPVISLPGLLLLGPRGDLIACNMEAIKILSYPDKPAQCKQLAVLVANKIPLELVLTVPRGRTVVEFVSVLGLTLVTVSPMKHSTPLLAESSAFVTASPFVVLHHPNLLRKDPLETLTMVIGDPPWLTHHAPHLLMTLWARAIA